MFESTATMASHQEKVFDQVDTDHTGSLSLDEAEAAIEIWAKSEGIKITKQGIRDEIGDYEDIAGKSGSLTKK